MFTAISMAGVEGGPLPSGYGRKLLYHSVGLYVCLVELEAWHDMADSLFETLLVVATEHPERSLSEALDCWEPPTLEE